MRPLLGDFLASASEQIDAVTRFNGPLPEHATRAVVWQLDQLVAIVTRFADRFMVDDEADRRQALDRQVHPVRDAWDRLRRAAGNLHMEAGTLEPDVNECPHPAAGRVEAAVNYLSAGQDLLQTHFAPGPFGSSMGQSEWAPVIVSAPVTTALLGEFTSVGVRAAGWAERLLMTPRADGALPAQAGAAVTAACQSLRLADVATRTAAKQHLSTAADRTMVHVIPAHVEPARYPPGSGETVPGLCMGLAHTAERLRFLAPAATRRADEADAGSSVCWQRTAHGAAISGHCSEQILRSLADRAGQLGLPNVVEEGLRQAAEATARSWMAWRAAAGAWDSLTTGTNTRLTPAAAEIGDLALWVGRLAYTGPAWAPGQDHANALRDPIGLAAGPQDLVNVLAAAHQANHTLAGLAAHDREAVGKAVAYRCLYVPTRLLPARYDVPRRYALTPKRMADALLSTYDAAVSASSEAASALDKGGGRRECPIKGPGHDSRGWQARHAARAQLAQHVG